VHTPHRTTHGRQIILEASGQLLPNTEAKVVEIGSGDDDGDASGGRRRLLGPMEQGELYIRGPQVMAGYHNNPAATRATIDADGWLRTGDIAYYDRDGYFYIVDRLKELIKTKGFQVGTDLTHTARAPHTRTALTTHAHTHTALTAQRRRSLRRCC
jgi:long-subunit acyl-CoA synthetase (AMP-forming)